MQRMVNMAPELSSTNHLEHQGHFLHPSLFWFFSALVRFLSTCGRAPGTERRGNGDKHQWELTAVVGRPLCFCCSSRGVCAHVVTRGPLEKYCKARQSSGVCGCKKGRYQGVERKTGTEEDGWTAKQRAKTKAGGKKLRCSAHPVETCV